MNNEGMWAEDFKFLIDRAIALETKREPNVLNVSQDVMIMRRGGQWYDNDYDVTIRGKTLSNFRCVTLTNVDRGVVSIKCKPIENEKAVLKLYRQQYNVLYHGKKKPPFR